MIVFTRVARKVFRLLSFLGIRFSKTTIQKIKDVTEAARDVSYPFAQSFIPILSLAAFIIFIYDAGFHTFYVFDHTAYTAWRWILIITEILLILRMLFQFREITKLTSRLFNFAIIVLVHYLHHSIHVMSAITLVTSQSYLTHKLALYVGTIFLFITEAANVLKFIYHRSINPAFLFVISFFTFICIGCLLLLLPTATHHKITFVDAWFTAASAVCVTGLTVVDIATTFTTMGHVILLLLIQLGGLGIMTFAGILTYLAAGTVSYKNQLALTDMWSTNRVGNAVSHIGRVIIVTLFFEALGAFFIYGTLPDGAFKSHGDKIFFAVFHAVSAFCNAGFSTFSNGLYELPLRFNYSLQLCIAALIILGGLGFPIVFNLFMFIRVKFTKLFSGILKLTLKENYTHILSASAQLALVTSIVLLTLGFIAFFIFEYNSTLANHPTLYGKIVTSFFGSVTPRTAGFNTVDMTALTLPTVMIYILLMWIGASPSSTGGGIKTTVIAVSFLNLRSIIFGKGRAEAFKTEITQNTINRAFAIISVSLFILGLTVLLLSLYDNDKPLLKLAFEAFSAFGTVGLTLGITPDLTNFSKIILSIVMLIGRVGGLTILFAFAIQSKPLYYRYPKEDILL